MNREKIEFTDEQLNLLFYEGIKGFELVLEAQTYFDSEKGYTDNDIVLKRLSDGKFFKGECSYWGQGVKEWASNEFEEVFSKQKKITIYE